MLSHMDLHHGSLDLHHPTPPPPPPPAHKPSLPGDQQDVKPRSILHPVSLPNGNSLKKQHRQEPPPLLPLPWRRRPGHGRRGSSHVVYRECMKNHAAQLGGHALDGCGEFMPSPAANPSEPASLTCAACGCHRNFHRRLLHHGQQREESGPDGDDEEAYTSSPSPPPQAAAFSQYYGSSAPHMLMALSAGHPAAAGATPGARATPGKRFRTKFTAEQKAGMQELCERLGWRLQRRDEALVEERCREIGVSRAVFKVWMHNNKHAFVGGPSSRRGGGGTGADGGDGGGGHINFGDARGYSGGGGEGSGDGISLNGDGGDVRRVVGGGGGGSGNGHAVSGSPLSS